MQLCVKNMGFWGYSILLICLEDDDELDEVEVDDDDGLSKEVG